MALTLKKPCPACGSPTVRNTVAETWTCATCAVTWRVGARHPKFGSERAQRRAASPPRRRDSQRVARARRRRWLAAVLIPLLWMGGCFVKNSIDIAQIENDAEERAERAAQEEARRQQRLASLPPAVEWTLVDVTCADGWRSDSIGRQGACSHHGGVVSVYEGSDGSVLRCAYGAPPYGKEAQADQRESPHWSGTYWCEHS